MTTNSAQKPRLGRPPLGAAALTHAQRQAKYRATLAAQGLHPITVFVTAATHASITAEQAANELQGAVIDAWAQKP